MLILQGHISLDSDYLYKWKTGWIAASNVFLRIFDLSWMEKLHNRQSSCFCSFRIHDWCSRWTISSEIWCSKRIFPDLFGKPRCSFGLRFSHRFDKTPKTLSFYCNMRSYYKLFCSDITQLPRSNSVWLKKNILEHFDFLSNIKDKRKRK